MLAFLLIGMLTLTFNIQPVKARSDSTIGFYGMTYEVYRDSLVSYLKTLGYTVFAVDELNFTYADIVYLDYRLVYPLTEEDLLDYVENGGSLWVGGEACGGAFLGVTISTNSIWFVGSLSDPRVWIIEHPVLQDVRSIAYPDGAWLEITGDIQGIMRIDGKTMLAVNFLERGKILWLIDSDIFGDYFLDDEDNRILARNIAAWLTPRTWTVDDDGPADFHTIKEAINAANSEDTIYVHSGTYYEHLTINKHNLALVGENPANTVVDGSGNGTVITITADYVTVTGLTIRNGYFIPHITYGLYVYNSDNIKITGNIISSNDVGVFLYYSRHTVVNSNAISNNYQGIVITLAENNTLENNTVFDNEFGIGMGSSANNNVILNNEIFGNNFGIHVGWSDYNNIVRNTITLSNEACIRLDASGNNNIIQNTITSSSRDGIVLFGSNNNAIKENELDKNNWDGIALWYSHDNIIYHNSFLNNAQQAGSYSGSTNIWDDGYPSGGNYWSDYVGVDVKNGPGQDLPGSDGMSDTSYIIDINNVDHYPLMNPYGAPLPSLYALTITTTVGGTTNPASGTYSYTANSLVQVTAIANANYVFNHWQLDSINVGSANLYTVLMNKNHALKAVFSPITPPKPVGGYSVTIEGYTPAQPLTPYIALAAFLMTALTIARRKTHQKTK